MQAPATELLKANYAWSQRMVQKERHYFASLEHQQNPRFLWFGCSDSRVPANQITGQPPGEIFVHRNIANQVSPNDTNALAVLQYGVCELKIAQIIVCGHYGCAGVHTALRPDTTGPLGIWLQSIRDIAALHASQLAALSSDQQRLDWLCELNVYQQVLHIVNTKPVQEAWSKGQPLAVHGWIYTLSNGRIADLGVSVSNPQEASALAMRLPLNSLPGGLTGQGGPKHSPPRSAG